MKCKCSLMKSLYQRKQCTRAKTQHFGTASLQLKLNILETSNLTSRHRGNISKIALMAKNLSPYGGRTNNRRNRRNAHSNRGPHWGHTGSDLRIKFNAPLCFMRMMENVMMRMMRTMEMRMMRMIRRK